MASNLRNTHTLFNYLMPVLTNCVALLNVYQNCPEVVVLVLEFYVDLVDSQIAFLDEVSHRGYSLIKSLFFGVKKHCHHRGFTVLVSFVPHVLHK